MKVVIYQNNDRLKNEYFELVKRKYMNLKNFEYFFSDLKKALKFSHLKQQPYFISVIDDSTMLAHAAVICDRQLPRGTAFWGFFETSDNEEVFQLLWEKIKEVAREKGINRLLGPVNGSIWHQYRFIKETDRSPFFKTELFCEPFYYKLVKKTQEKEILYYSAYRNNFDNIIATTEPFYKKIMGDGFSLIESVKLTEKDLDNILKHCKKIFRKSWGYIDLSSSCFADLYSSQKLVPHLKRIYFLKKNQQIVGYCSLMLEDRRTLILKSIAILPEFQKLKLANALIYKVHIDAQLNQHQKVIYALIKENNAIKKLPKDDAVIFRRYVAFESYL